MHTWKLNDWVIYELHFGQITALEKDRVQFSDGSFSTSGSVRMLEDFRPLTLRNKSLIESFTYYYKRLDDIDGNGGFNYPDINRHFCVLSRNAIDSKTPEDYFTLASQFVQDVREYKPVIQGVRLFRPK